MLKLSKFPFKTQKFAPKVSDNKSTSILLQAGFIRQTMAGVYTYTTLGLRVLEKIKNIVREEMNNYGAFETLMPSLSPRELWDKTGRWGGIDVMFHVPAANDKEYGLNSTHEEIVTPLMGEFIKSYKDLPACVYQIQNKFRNEKRAKSGLLRGREFLMKDAYSFHADNEEFERYYEGMKQVYLNVFARLGLAKDTFIAKADGGTFTDKYSHEFQVKLPIGEDIIFLDPETGDCFNKEVAPSFVGTPNIADKELKQKQDIEAIGIIGVEALSKALGVPAEKSTKTMMFEVDGRFIVASVRGDYEINTLKLQKILGAKSIRLASQELVKEKTGAEIGYAGIINLPKNTELYLDDSIDGLTNFETGTNKTGYHSINVNFGRDLEIPERFYDFKEAKLGDKNPTTGNIFEVFKASEVGNIFPLETKFSSAFGLNFLDENNTLKIPLMGCYGIGVSRVMGVVAEYFLDEVGIAWPKNIAPATHYIIVMGDNLYKAILLAQEIEETGGEVIIDDREKIGFGQKASDSDLFGIQNRIVISDNTLELGGYEIRKRGETESKIISFAK
ncbi:MAG: proline--tRNA ligase [Candidatus Gracilibacteria bacterium]|nr:proline--tRNA ligase [Candidatus Gracilibacteria bacterium]